MVGGAEADIRLAAVVGTDMRGDNISGAPNGWPGERNCCCIVGIPGDRRRVSAADCAKRRHSSSHARRWLSSGRMCVCVCVVKRTEKMMYNMISDYSIVCENECMIIMCIRHMCNVQWQLKCCKYYNEWLYIIRCSNVQMFICAEQINALCLARVQFYNFW